MPAQIADAPSMVAARRRGVTGRRRRSPTCGDSRCAGRGHRSRIGPRREPDLDPRAEWTPDRTQGAAVQLHGVARDDQTMTAARLPGARANVEQRPHQARPTVEHADRDVAAAHAARDGHGATAVLDGIRNQIVERLCESHRIPVDERRAGAPVERHLPGSHRQRHVPSVHDTSRDVLKVDQLGVLNRPRRQCAAGRLEVSATDSARS